MAKKRFLLRLDHDVYEALARWADDELRSVNGQIEFLLREALRRAGRHPKQRPSPDAGQRHPRTAGERPEGGSEG